MAVGKALARFGRLPLICVPTLSAMAHEAALATRAPLYIPMVDAKRGEVYTAPFRPGRNGVVAAGKPSVREPNALRASLPAGALVVEEPARARTYSALGFLAFSTGKRDDPDRLIPAYVRRPEAVEKRMARRRAGRRA